MSAILLLILACSLPVSLSLASNKSVRGSCEEFSRGAALDERAATGTWHLHHHRAHRAYDIADSKCATFTLVDTNEQKNLSNLIGKYVKDLKWETVTLRMQVPCVGDKRIKPRFYYLEKIDDGVGVYNTLQMPAGNDAAAYAKADFHRHPMRLKVVESEYLGMMDCLEDFMFLLSRQPQRGPLPDHLIKMVQHFWPKDDD